MLRSKYNTIMQLYKFFFTLSKWKKLMDFFLAGFRWGSWSPSCCSATCQGLMSWGTRWFLIIQHVYPLCYPINGVHSWVVSFVFWMSTSDYKCLLLEIFFNVMLLNFFLIDKRILEFNKYISELTANSRSPSAINRI